MAYIDINDTTSAVAGLATAANQLLQIALLTSLDNKTPTLGQKTMAGSSPVVIASDQSTVKVNLTNPSGISVGTPINPIYVTPISGTGGLSISKYNEVPLVATGVLTTILTYTVPLTKIGILERISVTGENIAYYKILKNAIVIDSKHTNFGTNLNEEFNYSSSADIGMQLAAGDIITVTVLHNRPSLANFAARLQVTEI